jgi:hypothetical protein
LIICAKHDIILLRVVFDFIVCILSGVVIRNYTHK